MKINTSNRNEMYINDAADREMTARIVCIDFIYLMTFTSRKIRIALNAVSAAEPACCAGQRLKIYKLYGSVRPQLHHTTYENELSKTHCDDDGIENIHVVTNIK